VQEYSKESGAGGTRLETRAGGISRYEGGDSHHERKEMDPNGNNTMATDDPFDSAMAAEARPQGPRTYFGQISVDVWHCVLVKGTGKVPFDSGAHSADQRCTAIDLTFQALPRDNGMALKPMTFGMIAESKEWASIVKPSLVAIGSDLRSIRDRYVSVQLVPTGRTYEAKNRDTGEKKIRNANTIKFVKLFASEAECRAASDAFFSQFQHGGAVAAPAPAPAPAASAQDAGRATAAKFLPALWRASGNSVERFEKLIKQTDACNKYFDLSSPEVLAVITA
jgi:hypothetical protein